MQAIELDEFTRAYIAAMLWAENDESTPQGGEPFDANYSADDIAPAAMEKIIADCAKFQADNAADLAIGLSLALRECTLMEYAGHDFWLTRQGHGCGFWDGDWPEDVGERLTDAAEAFGEAWPYVGDDGQIYL